MYDIVIYVIGFCLHLHTGNRVVIRYSFDTLIYLFVKICVTPSHLKIENKVLA